MCKIICITNRKLCDNDFLTQIEKIIVSRPDSVVLREKDLNQNDYTALARKVLSLCQKYSVAFTIHFYYQTALKLGIGRIHLPLAVLRRMSRDEKKCFSVIGVSCHSADEAKEAESLGASYITAGHIFPTDCKAGLAGRGLAFLREVKNRVDIPLYAIGGISPENAPEVISAGADGICIMSGFMKSDNPDELISAIKEKFPHE